MSVLLAVFEMNTKVRVGSDGIYARLHRFGTGFVTTL